MNRRILSPRAGLLVSVASVAVLAAACSSASTTSTNAGTISTAGTPATSSVSAGSSTYQKAVAYAACMRQHGVPNFPDPLPNGGFDFGSDVTGGSNGQFSSQYKAAVQACSSIVPSAPLSEQAEQKALNGLLKTSACMRAHGFKNFPDPTVDSAGVNLHIEGFDRSSPQFQRAWAICEPAAVRGAEG
jgi:hypothetical protein